MRDHVERGISLGREAGIGHKWHATNGDPINDLANDIRKRARRLLLTDPHNPDLLTIAQQAYQLQNHRWDDQGRPELATRPDDDEPCRPQP